MTHHRLLLGALLVGASALVHPVGAQINRNQQQTTGNQDVTFHVPLQLQGFDPLVTQAAVFCTATSPAGGHGQGQSNVTLTNGAYNSNVDVKVTVNATQGQQWNYNCKLSFYNSQTKAWDVGTQAWDKPQGGTTPTLQLNGTFTS